jgi:hypothetical protein
VAGDLVALEPVKAGMAGAQPQPQPVAPVSAPAK